MLTKKTPKQRSEAIGDASKWCLLTGCDGAAWTLVRAFLAVFGTSTGGTTAGVEGCDFGEDCGGGRDFGMIPDGTAFDSGAKAAAAGRFMAIERGAAPQGPKQL